MKYKHPNDPRTDAQYWNDTYPVGQPIALTEDDGSLTHTQTKGYAYDRASGGAVVMVTGRDGWYPLSRIKPR